MKVGLVSPYDYSHPGGVTSHEVLSDGTGIDHVFHAWGDAIVGAYMGCGVEF